MKKSRILVKDFVDDLRQGFDDKMMMTKYRLSEPDLQKVFEKLIDADFITVDELWRLSRISDSQVTRAFCEAQTAVDELNNET